MDPAATSTVISQPDLLPALLLAGLFVINVLALGYFLGGLLLMSWFELRSSAMRGRQLIAQAISHQLFTPHPLAWVFIILPVVIANAFYFLYLISSQSSLLGILGTLLPVMALVLMVGWIHRASWQPLEKGYQASHAMLGLVATVLASIIALVYLMKISPMEWPWPGLGKATLTTLPRWMHLMLLSMGAAGLAIGWHVGRADGPLASTLSRDDLATARRAVLRTALVALMLQLAASPLVLMTMHFDYMGIEMGVALVLSLIACVGTLVLLSADLNTAGQRVGRLLPHVTALMLVAVLSMVMTRHFYRDKAFAGVDMTAQVTLASNGWNAADPPAIRAMPGRELYMNYCHICHQSDKLAPSVHEIEALYRDDPDALVQWAMQPGRKRAKYGPMPPMSHVREHRLRQIAEYMLEAAKPAEAQPQPAAPR